MIDKFNISTDLFYKTLRKKDIKINGYENELIQCFINIFNNARTALNERKIEEKQLSSDALKSMQDAYDKFTEDSLKRYEDLSTEVQDLKKKLIEVTTQLSKEKQNYATLREEHDNLKISYNKLKKDFDDYKKKYK